MYNLIVKTGKEKINGCCGVYIYCYIKGERVVFNTEINTQKNDWSDSRKVIIGNSKETKDKNLIISSCINAINEVFIKYRLNRDELTPLLLKKEYDRYSNSNSFYDYAISVLNNKESLIAKSTFKHQRSILKAFNNYYPALKFSELDIHLIEEYQRKLLKAKKQQTYIYKSLKTIKSFLERAVRDKVIKENPFINFKLKDGHPVKVFLTDEEISICARAYRIRDSKLTNTEYKVLTLFLFACLTGLRISDVRQISIENIENGKLMIVMKKTRNITGRHVKFKLPKLALEIVDTYLNNRKKGKIFEDMITDQKINEYLKVIMKKLNIDKIITFHCARHSFATSFLRKNQNLNLLKTILGHSSIKEVMVYAHVLNDDVDNAMQAINF